MRPFMQHKIDHIGSTGGGTHSHNQTHSDTHQSAAQQGRQQWISCQMVNTWYPLRRAQEDRIEQRTGNGGHNKTPPQHRPPQRQSHKIYAQNNRCSVQRNKSCQNDANAGSAAHNHAAGKNERRHRKSQQYIPGQNCGANPCRFFEVSHCVMLPYHVKAPSRSPAAQRIRLSAVESQGYRPHLVLSASPQDPPEQPDHPVPWRASRAGRGTGLRG